MEVYLEFTEEEFILDAVFQKWVASPDEASNQFWTDFLKMYPNKSSEVYNARAILRSFYSGHDLSFAEKLEMWSNIKAAIAHSI